MSKTEKLVNGKVEVPWPDWVLIEFTRCDNVKFSIRITEFTKILILNCSTIGVPLVLITVSIKMTFCL